MMVEGKMFKTRLCEQYLRGHCNRLYCKFAHGHSDLRGSFSTYPPQTQENQNLRQRLNRMRSSPGRVTHGDKSHLSVRSRIDRYHTKRQQLDSQANYSGYLRVSDETDDQIKDRRLTSPNSKLHMDKKLRQVNSEIKMLDDEKRKLEIYLGDKVQEADTLKEKIHELEKRLSRGKEESDRITTRIKKFIKAHKHYLHLQEELKSSNSQLQKMGEQLDMHAAGPGYESGPKIIDDEAGGIFSSSLNESPKQKKARNFLEVHDTSNRVSPVNEDVEKLRFDKLSRQTEYHRKLFNRKEPETDGNLNNEHRSFTLEDKPGRETGPRSDAISSDKYKVSGAEVAPTGIMEHVMEEIVVEVNEKEEYLPEVEVASIAQDLAYLPAPSPFIPQNIHQEYKGNDAYVDVNGPEKEAVKVDVD